MTNAIHTAAIQTAAFKERAVELGPQDVEIDRRKNGID